MAFSFSENDINELQRLEESLWRSETRWDLAHQEKIFAPDFFEFGRSGRTYTREQLVRTTSVPINAKIPLANFRVQALDGNNALVTYVSEVQYELLEKANRSSIWSRAGESWQLRFHQGTPIIVSE